MPAGDGTGPMGMGPMTGRRAGFCAGVGSPGFVSSGGGYGGCGRGRGRGFRNRYLATGVTGRAWSQSGAAAAPVPMTEENETTLLRHQAAALQQSLDAVNQRIATLADE
jgi:hypothetical protein